MLYNDKFAKLEFNLSKDFKNALFSSLSDLDEEHNKVMSVSYERRSAKESTFLDSLEKLKERLSKVGKSVEQFNELVSYYTTLEVASLSQTKCSIEEEILKLFPQKLLNVEKPKLYWQTIDGGTIIPPHIDCFRRTTINLYVKVFGEKTVFYNKKRDGICMTPLGRLSGRLVSQSKNEAYDIRNDVRKTLEYFTLDWLEKDSEFVAEPFDAFLLNVSEPHSVVDIPKNKSRIGIAAGFVMNYSEVLSYFLETGNQS